MPWEGLKRIARERSKESVKDFWRHHKQFIAWCALTIGVTFASVQSYYAAKTAQDGVNKINAERTDRVTAQSSVNTFFCHENNRQDLVLGKLLQISLRSALPDSELTDEKRAQLQAFRRATKDLVSPTDCRELARQLARATGVDPDDIVVVPIFGFTLDRSGERQAQDRNGGVRGGDRSGDSPTGFEPPLDSGGVAGGGGGGKAGAGGTLKPKKRKPKKQGSGGVRPQAAPAPTLGGTSGSGGGAVDDPATGVTPPEIPVPGLVEPVLRSASDAACSAARRLFGRC